MKDLTISMPKWYDEKRDEYDKILKAALQRKTFKILVYSNVVKKVVVNAYDNCLDREVYGIYDFEKDVFYQVGYSMPICRVSGGVNSWSKKKMWKFCVFRTVH